MIELARLAYPNKPWKQDESGKVTCLDGACFIIEFTLDNPADFKAAIMALLLNRVTVKPRFEDEHAIKDTVYWDWIGGPYGSSHKLYETIEQAMISAAKALHKIEEE